MHEFSFTCRLPCLEEQLLVLREGETNFWDTPRFLSSLIMGIWSLSLDAVKMPSAGSGAVQMESHTGRGLSTYPVCLKTILNSPEEVPKTKRKGIREKVKGIRYHP